jgi:two-component system OmpR family sensor kinase
MSLRLRLLVVSVALVAGGLTTAGLVTYSTLSSFLQSRTESQLNAAAASVRHVIDDLPAGTTVDRQGLAQAAPGIWVQLRAADGTPVAEVQGYSWTEKPTSPALPDQLPSLTGGGYLGPVARFTTGAAQPDSSPFRVLVTTTAQGGTLVLGASQQETERTLARLVKVELIAGGLILLMSALSGLWLMRLGLRPLVRMEAAAENIAEENIGERLPGAAANTEVGRLARVLNTMLGRLEAAFTERRETEERLRKSEERLRRFAADASHELRTPIASVRAYTELYRRRGGDGNDAGYVIAQIEQESRRLSTLVDDLLLLARLDDGRPLAAEPVDLGALADTAVQAARVLDPDRMIELIVLGSVEVRGDRDRLRQVIDNLLTNVLTHTPAGTPALVTVTSEAGDAVLEVADRGLGLSETEHERVFERFYRADPSRARLSGGAGLGLSILASIVAAHGGRATVDHRVGGGLIFRVTLPVLVDPLQSDADSVIAEAAGMSQPAHRNGVHDGHTQQGGHHDRQGDPPSLEPSHP